MKDSTEHRPELLDVLSAGPVGVTSPDEVARERARMLPWLEEQVAALPERRVELANRARFRRVAAWGGAVLAAAAFAAAVFFQGAFVDGQVESASNVASEKSDSDGFGTVVSGRLRSGAGSYIDGQRLALKGRIETGDVGAALQVSQGYQIELGPSSALTFEPEAQSETGAAETLLRLHHGEAKLSVRRPTGTSLRVITSDASLIVVKSAFSIEPLDGKSCIRVSEGSVIVRRGAVEEVVDAGDSSGCLEASSGDRVEKKSPTSKKTVSSQRTTLSQENALLARALAAESRGDTKRAKQAYRELLSKYPRSSFAQDAEAGLVRLEQP